MTDLFRALMILLPLTYGVSLVLYIVYFNVNNDKYRRQAYALVVAGVVLHLMYLALKGWYFRYFPITNTFESFSMIAISTSIIYLLLERIQKEGKTGLFFMSIAFIFQLVASMFMKDGASHNALLSNPMFGFHTISTLLGITALAISALYGLMYWMLAKEIKAHRFGTTYNNLPPLETIEDMGRTASVIGLVLLGLGILLGHFWAYRMLGYFFTIDPKIIVADLAWLSYAIGWFWVIRGNLAGLRMSRIAFWGFFVFFFSMILINLLGDTFHKFV